MHAFKKSCLSSACLMTLAITSVASAAAIGDSEEPGKPTTAELKDIALMQGQWEMTVNTANGPVRTVKEIEGNKTYLRRYDANDALLWGHRSEFKVSIAGGVKIFTFSNVEVTDGPQKGAVSNRSHSYIYRIEDDVFVEAVGLLADPPQPAPEIRIWRRVK